MNKKEARSIQQAKLAGLRRLSYGDLVERFIGGQERDTEKEPETEEIAAESGQTYQIEVMGFWDGKPGDDLRVVVAIDDGGLRAFFPLTDSFIIAPDGFFVGE